MRSRTGCLTCRQRKLKCDEKKPKCGQCCKATRECIPSSGIVFRHQHNASMNGDDSSDENTLKGFYAYKNTFNDETIWLDVPKHITFINTSNPYLDDGTSDLDTMSATSMDSPAPFEPRSIPTSSWPGASHMHTVTSSPSSTSPELLAPAATSAHFSFMQPDHDLFSPFDRPAMLQTPPTSTAGTPVSPPLSLPNYHFNHLVLDQCMTPPIDPRLNSPFDIDQIPRSVSVPRRTSSRSSFNPSSEQDHEVAYLLRWFSEGPGYWMDLYDMGKYFSSYVPIKATDSPLLKYAALAYAAKSLARLQGKRTTATGARPYSDAQLVDWSHKATQYYDSAVSLLLQALKGDAMYSTDSDSDCEQKFELDRFARRRAVQSPRRRRTSSNASKYNQDDVLAASAILCVYESLDASMSEWAKHLNGAKSLLVMSQERLTPMQVRAPSPTASLGFVSKTRRAAFWNVARQDMWAAFINKTHTRLDTEDLPLWRDAGLLIDDHGFIIPSNTFDNGYPEGDGMMKEDIISNTLVWLMAKLVNFMAAGDEVPVDFSNTWGGVPQRSLSDCWYQLRQQFQTWYDALPVTFQPCSKVESPRSPGHQLDGDDAMFPEIWYSMPMCASTMQCYHMSQIQLLMNKPHESTQGRTSVFERLNSYQSVLAASQVHSREIIGISLARSDDAMRVHSVQPLFTAGQCLSDVRERQVVLNLLQDVEAETGWATDYRVKQLAQQWQWEENESAVP
ncbi:hypothetical protein BU24DRAFT_37313 [Aaosphaeria arxii CBS 175.79]|uniref:Zn(2)-C6 fungal-type domain-containing protein n=1 Tax=Aaosphaeria arxii CBS 175.79 TaxID=1450172 RepID=A0A6A5YBJ9_9PLEO|nr:uncharacterized protein BU24DRAFT_37313 [Aaosphaeria arxii CBS 175.79]KAF2022091.1 hypothetical protein BU24DRAFT_37313 [Aaosphaeria arxii CBS 175.79]